MTWRTSACSISRSCASALRPRKSKRYGSLMDSRARSDCGAGSVDGKLVSAWPLRSSSRASICITSTLRDHLCSIALAAYQRRACASGSLSSSASWWYQGNRASTACTNSPSCQASANARMYFRLRGEKPFMSGKAVRRSLVRLMRLLRTACLAAQARQARAASGGQHSAAALRMCTSTRSSLSMTAGPSSSYSVNRWKR